ncbi:GNAT family N-acetyltransferase [Pseudomonas protegens]|uniref:GNAT family N-acetyltransferase n=1 Tax=Pseudomonas protegens TaxID=380021 RepID=UPI0016194F49
MAASKFFEHYVSRAVYFADKPIGFTQYYPNFGNGRPDEMFIDQLMIDVNHQLKGCGTKTVALALDEIRQMKSSDGTS